MLWPFLYSLCVEFRNPVTREQPKRDNVTMNSIEPVDDD
ncbi:hypothetical protein VFA_003493 [Vibrio furnissii CIP 102972]|nr:hypothetical protein VFA_003493 [Vibrio furnissii CIP 102972]